MKQVASWFTQAMLGFGAAGVLGKFATRRATQAWQAIDKRRALRELEQLAGAGMQLAPARGIVHIEINRICR